MFVHDTGLWPSSNIREHARRIVSRQKSEHDRQIPEYTFNENVLTWVRPEVSSIGSAFYITDIRPRAVAILFKFTSLLRRWNKFETFREFKFRGRTMVEMKTKWFKERVYFRDERNHHFPVYSVSFFHKHIYVGGTMTEFGFRQVLFLAQTSPDLISQRADWRVVLMWYLTQ